jgi:hypothetical protein
MNQSSVCVDILLERKTMNGAYYCDLLKHKLKPAIRTKRSRQLSKGVITLNDNACPHSAQAAGDVLD